MTIYNNIIYKRENDNIVILHKFDKLITNPYNILYNTMINHLQVLYNDVEKAIKLYTNFKNYNDILNSNYQGIFFIKTNLTTFTIYNKNNNIINPCFSIGLVDDNNITKLSFDFLKIETIEYINYNDIIKLNNVPNMLVLDAFPNVKIIHFHESFCNNLILPNSVEEIFLPDTYNLPILNFNNLKIIHFGSLYNKNISCSIDKIEELYFGYGYDHPINLPNSLKKLEFYNGPKLDFPQTLTHLTLKNYRHEIKYLENLQYLCIKCPNYNQLLGVFPNVVYVDIDCPISDKIISFKIMFPKAHTLILGEINNKMMGPNFFPPNLEKLVIKNYKGVLDYKLPNLKYLEFGGTSQVLFCNNIICDNLEYFKIGNQNINLHTLPPNIHTLELGEYYNFEIVSGTLPKNITNLYLGDKYNCKIFCLENTKLLKLGNYYNQIFGKNILCNLDELYIGNSYNKELSLYNTNIKKLHIASNNIILKDLPKNLEELHIDNINLISNIKLPKTIIVVNTNIQIYGRKNIKNYILLNKKN